MSHLQDLLAAHQSHLGAVGVQHWRVRRAGVLHVQDGALWLTRPGHLTDHVLPAGSALPLAVGEQVTLSAWEAGKTASGVSWHWQPQGRAVPRALHWAAHGLARLLSRLARGLDALAARCRLDAAGA